MTRMLRILIAEDEATIARRLARLTRDILRPRECELTIAPTLGEARDAARNGPPDLLILDLRLEADDGFDLLRDPVLRHVPTVIVSAHTNRALEAFDHGARDFVAKPFGRTRLETAIHRVLDVAARPGVRPEFVRVKSRSAVDAVPLEQIVFVRANGTASELVLANGSVVSSERMLNELEQALPRRFVRIHRSFIVDIGRVRRLVSGEGSRYRIVLQDGTSLPVGRSRLPLVREHLL